MKLLLPFPHFPISPPSSIFIQLAVSFFMLSGDFARDLAQFRAASSPFPSLRAVVYVEFDNKRGPTPLHSFPSLSSPSSPLMSPGLSSILDEDFDIYTEYFIPQTEVSNTLVCFGSSGWVFVGAPQAIIHEKYPRNGLYFNVVFVLTEPHGGTSISSVPESLRSLVQKTCSTLTAWEKESEVLSNPKLKDECIPVVLRSLFECISGTEKTPLRLPLSVGGLTRGNRTLQVDPSLPHVSPKRIEWVVQTQAFPHCIPVKVGWVSDKDVARWDWAAGIIWASMDGEASIREMSSRTGIQIDLARTLVASFVQHNVVKLIMPYRNQGIYEATWRMREFFGAIGSGEHDLEFLCLRWGIANLAEWMRSIGVPDLWTLAQTLTFLGQHYSQEDVRARYRDILRADCARRLTISRRAQCREAHHALSKSRHL
eukprot:TRINITY_DN12891_c0_g1_i2.p1 TRINITY_DN12891_c0_g1~~TRINITY_DN12891_c0_g1_i2.p1  ORF type:complete len:440 (-),score=109.44 TRINITY_DN12891_c0_g1_i2:27-1304(-)